MYFTLVPAPTVAVTGQTQIRGSPVPPTMNPPENAEYTNQLSQGSGSGISTSRCGSGSLSTAGAAARQNRTRVLSPSPDFSQEKLQGSLRQSPRSCHSFSWRCQRGAGPRRGRGPGVSSMRGQDRCVGWQPRSSAGPAPGTPQSPGAAGQLGLGVLGGG